jgi:hypothetical protein
MNVSSKHTYVFLETSAYKEVAREGDEEFFKNQSKLTLYSESLNKGFVVKEIKINGNLIDTGNLTPEKLAIIQKLAFEHFSDLDENDIKLKENLKKSEEEIKSDAITASEDHVATQTVKKNVKIDKVTKAVLLENEDDSANILDRSQVVNAVARNSIIPTVYPPDSELEGEIGIEFTLATCPAPIGKGDVNNQSFITLEYNLDSGPNILAPELLGTQVVTRSETLGSALILCNNMVSRLQLLKNDTLRLLENSKNNDGSNLQNKLQEIYKKLDFYSNQKANLENYESGAPDSKKGWLASEYFRDSIRQLSKQGSDYNSAVEKYVAVPPNMRQQRLEGDTSVQYGRTGVISDMRNGWVSYHELEQMVKQDEKGFISLSQIDAKIANLKKVKVKIEGGLAFRRSSKMKKKNQLLSVNEGIENLSNLKTYINLFNGAKSRKDQVDIDCQLNNINSILLNRELVLEQQMMIYLQDQFANNPEYINKCIAEGKSIDVIHVGLLNMGKKKTDATGWRHDEQVQMEDMNAIFTKFHGKKLVFAASGGPFIGDDALVFSIPGINAGSSTLGTYFFNTSVQGDRKNSGAQRDNNLENLSRYRDTNVATGTPFLDGMANRLESVKQTDYALATELVRTFRDEKGSKALLSFGCVSAKDRSGVVGEMLMQEPLKERLTILGVDVKAFFRKHLFSSKGAAIQIIRENLTPHSALKTKPFDLPIRFQSQLWEAMKALGRKLIGRKSSD